MSEPGPTSPPTCSPRSRHLTAPWFPTQEITQGVARTQDLQGSRLALKRQPRQMRGEGVPSSDEEDGHAAA
jgi:hypothetical protein